MERFKGLLISGVIIVVVVVAGKHIRKEMVRKDYHNQCIEICAGEPECIDAVNLHFDDCFNKNFDYGGRRQGVKIDVSELVECLNDNSGIEYFEVDD